MQQLLFPIRHPSKVAKPCSVKPRHRQQKQKQKLKKKINKNNYYLIFIPNLLQLHQMDQREATLSCVVDDKRFVEAHAPQHDDEMQYLLLSLLLLLLILHVHSTSHLRPCATLREPIGVEASSLKSQGGDQNAAFSPNDAPF
jgi:hypothetical protein